MENRIIRRNEHKIFIIMFNDDKMVKNALKKKMSQIILCLIINRKPRPFLMDKKRNQTLYPQMRADCEKI